MVPDLLNDTGGGISKMERGNSLGEEDTGNICPSCTPASLAPEKVWGGGGGNQFSSDISVTSLGEGRQDSSGSKVPAKQ